MKDVFLFPGWQGGRTAALNGKENQLVLVTMLNLADLSPTREQYIEQARLADLVPVSLEILADLETPISVYKKLATGGPAYLLESVEGVGRVARYSFIGVNPYLNVSIGGGQVEITDLNSPAGLATETVETRNPLPVLRRLLSSRRLAPVAGFPGAFGGLVGYFGYDMVRYIEDIPRPKGPRPEIPDARLMAPAVTVVFDHLRRRARIVCNLPVKGEPGRCYDRAVELIGETVASLRSPLAESGGANDTGARVAGGGSEASRLKIRAKTDRAAYEASVARAKEHIAAGDIFQVVLSQRFEAECPSEPLDVYRMLRATNPSPYMFFLDFGDLKLAGSSPEMMVRVENGMVQTRPIAGTRRRGSDEREDDALEAELLADEKERAEHVMLVDLGRNDVGRVSRPGTVQVEEFMKVERYSHVMHIVSSVAGELAPGMAAVDALTACFPAGTLSGAPKVRAMEIISQLEPCGRGAYGGAVGYLNFDGTMDTCITIRTLVFEERPGAARRVTFQTGAGIVADSSPEAEYHECLHKAGALIKALELANGGER